MPTSTLPALIVIDVQEGFGCQSFWGRRDNPAAESNIETLVTAWEQAHAPIVVVQHRSRAVASPLHPRNPGHALKTFVRGRGTVLVTKEVNSAFYGDPDLHSWLTGGNIDRLVLCGIQTNMCVETTARMAGNLGYDTTVILDACHTFDLTGPFGTVSADELTRATATNLAGGGFAKIATTADVVSTLTR